ncbi:SseB family protein [Nocardioides sp. Y6]|uniref:SseB family protein n=1 Tax=Nocardioides malaquae TaxID=2773426 RepID=A0ABR9RNA0_9ACTN|nr:SseB family protein [Nocardioides malaquae]MBE7323051.1 SseB family protein [Nocardioides malaquae]
MVDPHRFAGAEILQSSFPDDDGRVAPELEAALQAYAGDRQAFGAVVGALAPARLLVPVVAVLGEVEVDEQGLAHDKSSDMATVLVTGADGRQALLAFTSTETLHRWNPEARPVPVPAPVAAQSAVQESAAALVVDIAGPVTFVLEERDLEAFAAGWSFARVGDRTGWIRDAP